MIALPAVIQEESNVDFRVQKLVQKYKENPMSLRKCRNCGHEAAHRAQGALYCIGCLKDRHNGLTLTYSPCTEAERVYFDMLFEIATLEEKLSRYEALRRCLTCSYIGEGFSDNVSGLDKLCPKCRTTLVLIRV